MIVHNLLPEFKATDETFVNKTLEELMELNRKKVEKGWSHKIVLPEARKTFKARHDFHLEQAGQLPVKFL